MDFTLLIAGIMFDDVLSLETFCIHYEVNGKRFVYKDNVLASTATVSMQYIEGI